MASKAPLMRSCTAAPLTGLMPRPVPQWPPAACSSHARCGFRSMALRSVARCAASATSVPPAPSTSAGEPRAAALKPCQVPHPRRCWPKVIAASVARVGRSRVSSLAHEVVADCLRAVRTQRGTVPAAAGIAAQCGTARTKACTNRTQRSHRPPTPSPTSGTMLAKSPPLGIQLFLFVVVDLTGFRVCIEKVLWIAGSIRASGTILL